MDHSADVIAMAIVVEQEEEEEAANRRRGDSPPPYQQAVVDEEEEELDVTVYPRPQLWDQLDRLEEHCQTFDEASYSTRFWKVCLYGLGSKSPSYLDNLKRACFAGWVLLKDSIFPLVGNKLAIFVWTLGHFLCALSILVSASIEEAAADPWFYTVSVVLASIAFLLASADLLCVMLFKCDISKGTQRNRSVLNTPLLRENRPSVLSGCWLCFKRYTGLLRLVTAELLVFLMYEYFQLYVWER